MNFVHGGIENTSAAIVPNQFLSQLDSEVLQRGKCGIGGKLLVEDVAVGDGNVTGYGEVRTKDRDSDVSQLMSQLDLKSQQW